MMASRAFLLLSCAGLLSACWIWALLSPAAVSPMPLWPLQAWGWWGLMTSTMSAEARDRRLHFTLALLLLLSTWVLPSWHLLMPEAQWLAQGQPAKPGLQELLLLWQHQLDAAVTLQWVPGLWALMWPASLLGLFIVTVALVVQLLHPLTPTWSQGLAQLALWTWLATVVTAVQSVAPDGVSQALHWVFTVLVVSLWWQPAANKARFGKVTWFSLCLMAACQLALNVTVPLPLACDVLMALACMLSLACGLDWYSRMEAIARFNSAMQAERAALAAQASTVPEAGPSVLTPSESRGFDLTQHLDSPQAQEGADKYTRE